MALAHFWHMNRINKLQEPDHFQINPELIEVYHPDKEQICYDLQIRS